MFKSHAGKHSTKLSKLIMCDVLDCCVPIDTVQMVNKITVAKCAITVDYSSMSERKIKFCGLWDSA